MRTIASAAVVNVSVVADVVALVFPAVPQRPVCINRCSKRGNLLYITLGRTSVYILYGLSSWYLLYVIRIVRLVYIVLNCIVRLVYIVLS